MSGRLIFEYRSNGRVTRIERDVREQNVSWLDVSPETLALSASDAIHDLLLAEGYQYPDMRSGGES